MAILLGNGTSRRFSGRSNRSLNSDINVTPFVDVMLVLLVIFMVTTPLMTVGVPLDLPKTEASSITEKAEPLTISVTAEGHIYLMDTPIDLDTLIQKLQAASHNKPETRVYVRGDQSVHYGLIMQVIGRLNVAGFDKVALLAELPTETEDTTELHQKRGTFSQGPRSRSQGHEPSYQKREVNK